MIATRFRTIGWVAGVATAALCCYLVSQSVAAERAGLARVDRRIADTQADIHRLNTEIGTRGRMSQLDRWNSEVLALQAPGARQFMASEVQLASLTNPRPLPIDPAIAATKGAVEQAAYRAPAPSAPPPAAVATPPAEPLLRVATYVRAKPDRLGSTGGAAPIVKVAFADVDMGPPEAKPVAAAKVATSAPLNLLPDDIDTLAAAERKAKTRR